jgi:predicted RNA binding protein YcfA (HicA-like mRNA interferase family)
MTGKLPRVGVAEVIRKLRRAGFVFDRQAKGSHEIWRHPATGRRVVIPNHPGAIPTGTLRQILRQAGLTPDSFAAL